MQCIIEISVYICLTYILFDNKEIKLEIIDIKQQFL